MEEMMVQKIEDALLRRKDRRKQMVLEEDLFALKIIEVPIPKSFKQSMREMYDEVMNSLDPLQTFVDLMRLYAAPYTMTCRSFSLTLRREIRD